MYENTHILAFVGDLLIAGVKLGEDLDAEIRNTMPDDVIEAYEKEGYTRECFLSNEELDDADLIYEGNAYGYLPDDDEGNPYRYAYDIGDD